MPLTRLPILRSARATIAAGLLAIAGFAATPAALAAEPDPCVEAANLIGADAGDMSTAECREVVEAAETERWQLSLDMALAHEQSAALESAIAYYKRFIAETSSRARPLNEGWTKVHEDAKAAVIRLEKKLLQTRARIGVRTQPEGATAILDGGAAVLTPYEQYLAPGPHTLEVHHPTTRQRLTRAFDVIAGQELNLEFDLHAPKSSVMDGGPAAANPHAVAAPPKKSASSGSTWRAVGATSIGLGVASAIVGTIFYVSGQGAIDEAACGADPDCNANTPVRARRRADGEDLQDQGTIAWIAGGVLVAGGLVALLLAPDDDAKTSSSQAGPRLQAVQPLIGVDGAGVGATVAF